MITSKDYRIAALVGILAGVFAIPTLINLGIDQRFIFYLLPFVLALTFIFGVWFGGFLGRLVAPFFSQLGKFGAIGFLNTAIDFGIINLLNMATGIASGFFVAGINIPGFLVASFNSYLWNKFWVFQDRDTSKGVFRDFPKFFAVTLIGIVINSGIVFLVTTVIAAPFGLNDRVWLNIAKASAIVISTIWNFIGYKLIVFHPTEERPRGV